MEYFSDTEKPPKARQAEALSPQAWGGIVAIVSSLMSKGAFGAKYPEVCPDGAGVIGVDEKAFELALRAEVPDIDWPLKTTTEDRDSWESTPYAPDTLPALDFIQFCFMNVAKPIGSRYHDFFRHTHLSFDVETGQKDFRADVNRIFHRNSIAFELLEDGNIIRLSNPILQAALVGARYDSTDSNLNEMLEESVSKFLNPEPSIRRDGLERLWDAWERLKSLQDPSNKKRSVKLLLDNASSEVKFRDLLEGEAKTLTSIGNTFHIRHAEVTQTHLEKPTHLDYLYHRLFTFIQMLMAENA